MPIPFQGLSALALSLHGTHDVSLSFEHGQMALVLGHDQEDHSHNEADAQDYSLDHQQTDHQDHVIHLSKAKDAHFTVTAKTVPLQKPIFLSQVILSLPLSTGFNANEVREHPSPALNPILVCLRTTVLVI